MKLRNLVTCLWSLIFFAAVLVASTVVEMYALLIENPFASSLTITLSIIKGINCLFNFLTFVFHIEKEIRRDLVPRTVWGIWVGRRTLYWLTWSVITCFSFGLMFLILLGSYIPTGTIHVIIVVPQVADIITTVLAAVAATFYTYRIMGITDPMPIREAVKKLRAERKRAHLQRDPPLLPKARN